MAEIIKNLKKRGVSDAACYWVEEELERIKEMLVKIPKPERDVLTDIMSYTHEDIIIIVKTMKELDALFV